jgi:hypothetical protein
MTRCREEEAALRTDEVVSCGSIVPGTFLIQQNARETFGYGEKEFLRLRIQDIDR